MVFSTELGKTQDQMGFGRLVACKHRMSSAVGLIEEAEFLWAAEQNSEERTGSISASWGCIAILANPNSQRTAAYVEMWATRTKSDRNSRQLNRAHGETELVDSTGRIAIPWPQRKDGKSIEFDVLLMTATNPTIVDGRYPSPEEISNAWKTPSGKAHINYFFVNRRCGIETFQDAEIEALLRMNKG